MFVPLVLCHTHLQNPTLHLFHFCICTTDHAGETRSALTSNPWLWTWRRTGRLLAIIPHTPIQWLFHSLQRWPHGFSFLNTPMTSPCLTSGWWSFLLHGEWKNSEENREGSHPHIPPPVSTCRHTLCFRPVHFQRKFLPRRFTCSILKASPQPVHWIRPTFATQGHPTGTSSHSTRPFLSAYKHAGIFPTKRKTQKNPFIDSIFPFSYHPFSSLPTTIKFFFKVANTCSLRFLSPISLFSHFSQAFISNRLPLTRSSVAWCF